jgi:hypothetical protein
MAQALPPIIQTLAPRPVSLSQRERRVGIRYAICTVTIVFCVPFVFHTGNGLMGQLVYIKDNLRLCQQ